MSRALGCLLLAALLSACWVTPKEVRKKVREYDDREEVTEPPVADTAAPPRTT